MSILALIQLISAICGASKSLLDLISDIEKAGGIEKLTDEHLEKVRSALHSIASNVHPSVFPSTQDHNQEINLVYGEN